MLLYRETAYQSHERHITAISQERTSAKVHPSLGEYPLFLAKRQPIGFDRAETAGSKSHFSALVSGFSQSTWAIMAFQCIKSITCVSPNDILKNETYAGKWHYAKTETRGVGDERKRASTDPEQWVEVDVPPIISAEQYGLVQERLKDNLEILRGRPSRYFNLLRGLVRCRHCELSVRGNYQPPRKNKDGKETSAQWSYVCSGTDNVPKICSLPAFNGYRVDAVVWDWLVSPLTNPELVECKLRARQAELNEINAPYLERIATIESLITEKRGERNRYISMAGRGIITEDELETLAGRLVKDIAELELQKAKAQERIEMPFSDEEIAAIVADSHRLAETREDFINASDDLKRRNLERYHLRVVLEAPAEKVRIAHVSCILGSNELEIPFEKKFTQACWFHHPDYRYYNRSQSTTG